MDSVIKEMDWFNNHRSFSLTATVIFYSPPTFSCYVSAGHGSLPQLAGNVNDIIISPLLQSCYQSSQALPQVYQHYGPSPIQPLSTEMQILLTVYYLVQLGPHAKSRLTLLLQLCKQCGCHISNRPHGGSIFI